MAIKPIAVSRGKAATISSSISSSQQRGGSPPTNKTAVHELRVMIDTELARNLAECSPISFSDTSTLDSTAAALI